MLCELNDLEIDALLRTERVGRIGCHAGGITYVVPVGYAYDGDSIVTLSPEGMKLRMMRENPRVCFEVEHIEHWTNWRTVIAWGNFEELAGDAAQDARKLLHATSTPLMELELKLRASEPGQASGTAGAELVVCRIKLDERTGRCERLQ